MIAEQKKKEYSVLLEKRDTLVAELGRLEFNRIILKKNVESIIQEISIFHTELQKQLSPEEYNEWIQSVERGTLT